MPRKRINFRRRITSALGIEPLEDRHLLATIIVNSALDESDGSITDGDISLRDAISLSALNDTIRFRDNLNGQTIQLTLGELVIGKSLTIDASTLSNGLIVDASGSDLTPDTPNGDGSRVMEIDDQEASLSNVTLIGLTITGGDVTGAGGGIRSRENLTLRRSIVTGNTASNSAPGVDYEGDGGGVWAYAPAISVVVEDSRIENNAGDDDGGGLSLATGTGSIRISRSIISQNHARGDDPAGLNSGGGARIVAQVNATVVVEDTAITDNQAQGVGFTGSGLTINGNGDVTLSRLNVSGNSGAVEGGGVFGFLGTGVLQVIDSRVNNNTAQRSGGGMSLLTSRGEVIVERSVIEENELQGGDTEGQGAGMRVAANQTGSITIRDSKVLSNHGDPSTTSGAGISFVGAGPLTIERSTVSGNTGGEFGGGILAVASSTRISHSVIQGNQGRNGGGIYADTELTIDNTTISGNSASESGGGASLHGASTITSSTISGNTARIIGGGISSGRFTQTNLYRSLLTMTNTTVSGNSSNYYAGGIFLIGEEDTPSVIRHSTITGNVADADTNSEGSAGGLYLFDGQLNVSHAIIARNSDNGNGSPDLLATADGPDGTPPELSLQYSLIGDRGDVSALFEAPVGEPDVNGNLIGGSTNGVINPRLGALANNGGATMTHAPLSASPAINAGSPDFDPPPTSDQRGAPFVRVQGVRVDMGAVEAQPSPADLNDDGAINCADIDPLVMSIVTESYSSMFDLNADAAVDHRDLDLWLAIAGLTITSNGAPISPGDANLDGRVDATDFAVWSNRRFTATGAWCRADFNADGATDVTDFNLWLSNRFVTPAAIGQARASRQPRAADAIQQKMELEVTAICPNIDRVRAEVVDAVFAMSPATHNMFTAASERPQLSKRPSRPSRFDRRAESVVRTDPALNVQKLRDTRES